MIIGFVPNVQTSEGRVMEAVVAAGIVCLVAMYASWNARNKIRARLRKYMMALQDRYPTGVIPYDDAVVVIGLRVRREYMGAVSAIATVLGCG